MVVFWISMLALALALASVIYLGGPCSIVATGDRQVARGGLRS
jgi:hypothetical protein